MPIGNDNEGRDKGPAENEKMMMNGNGNTKKPDTNVPAQRPVERVTALRGHEFPAPRMTKKVRKKLYDRLFLQDSDLPYAELEEALGRMFLSVVERQDRLGEGLLIRLNAIEYRLDELEHERDPDEGGA